MASVLVRRSISKEAAEEQFDLFFDEYFKPEPIVKAQGFLSPEGTGNLQGEDRFECGSAGEEVDEVYVPDDQRALQEVAERQGVCELAHMLRDLGDRYNKEWGQPLVKADTMLTALFTQATLLEYNTFRNAVEGLTTNDRNTTDFVFMMCVSRKVVGHVGDYANKAKNYFRRYLGETYIGAVANAGGVSEFVGPVHKE